MEENNKELISVWGTSVCDMVPTLFEYKETGKFVPSQDQHLLEDKAALCLRHLLPVCQ